MQKQIRIMTARYPDIHIPQGQGKLLRGFFAAGQGEGSLLHNHGEQGAGIYRYPLVQYKVIHGTPTVLAIEEGIEAIQPLVIGCQRLLLGGRYYNRGQLCLSLDTAVVGETEERCRYRFRTPWFGLNQENYRRYEQAGPEQRQALLKRVLTGNLLSLSKGLGVTVERRLEVECALQVCGVRFKEENVLGFLGGFSVNFRLPELLGLGKSVSRGLGAVSGEP